MKCNRLRLKAGIVFVALLCGVPSAFAQRAPGLGAAQAFAILAGSTVTNTGPSVVNGDLGLSPGSSVTGFGGAGNGTVNGTSHITDSAAANAQAAMTTAYNELFASACDFNFGPGDKNLGGLTLTPGVYCFASSASLTGTVTLNAQGDPNAVFIFKTGTAGASTLTTAPGSLVILANGAQACNVFWAVSSSATIDTTSTFVGNILAQASVTVNNGAHLFGRAFAKAAVTLINDVVDATVCAAVAGGTGGSGGSGGSTTPCVPGTGNPPVITSIPSQVIPVVQPGASVAVGFTISGANIPAALQVRATSSDGNLVPANAMVITNGAGGARVLTITGADGRSGVTTITITVTDANGACVLATSTSFQLTVGTAVPVPTMPQWALMALAALLALAGFAAMQRRKA